VANEQRIIGQYEGVIVDEEHRLEMPTGWQQYLD
jgi:hypothetical protein